MRSKMIIFHVVASPRLKQNMVDLTLVDAVSQWIVTEVY